MTNNNGQKRNVDHEHLFSELGICNPVDKE